jgi:glutathione S-transferase
MLGEPLLRFRARNLRGPVSAPLLQSEGTRTMGAFAIAKVADARGLGPKLCSDERVPIIGEQAEALMQLGRVLVTHRVSLDRDAKQEALVGVVPSLVRGMMTTLVDGAIFFLRRKYDYNGDSLEADEAAFIERLHGLRELLGGRATLLDGFSYADIAMALALQAVKPVDDRYIPLGPATRRCWTQPRLDREFADLLEWRDTLYAAYR